MFFSHLYRLPFFFFFFFFCFLKAGKMNLLLCFRIPFFFSFFLFFFFHFLSLFGYKKTQSGDETI